MSTYAAILVLPLLNSLNLFTVVHLLLTVELWMGVIFMGVGLFPGLCGFVLAAPAQQHIKMW